MNFLNLSQAVLNSTDQREKKTQNGNKLNITTEYQDGEDQVSLSHAHIKCHFTHCGGQVCCKGMCPDPVSG